MTKKILYFTMWLFVWLILSWPPTPRHSFMGVIVALFVTFMTLDTFESIELDKAPAGRGIFNRLSKIFYFLCYVAVFLWECFKANLDVAWRVIHPSLPIRPGTIKVKTALRSDIGLTFLANSITLTPGTTTVDIDKENGYIYIHMLSMKKGYPGPEARLPVVSRFERILMRIFG